MAVFLTRNNLSSDDLRLFLSNSYGYAQDAASVKWTVYARDGKQVSGRSLPAIRKTTGQYYAPWFTNVPNGNYTVSWEVTQEFGGPTVTLTDFIFVVDPSSYQCNKPINKDAVPVPGQFTFLTGQALGPGDLPLYLKNNAGAPQNAFAVFFTIFDPAGNCVTARTSALSDGVGQYYAPFFVNLCSGNYVILWEWQSDQITPLKSTRMGFSVVDPPTPYSVVVPILCASSLFSFNCAHVTRPIMTRVLLAQCEAPCATRCGEPFRHEPCSAFIPPPPMPPGPVNPQCPCDFEISRAIHLDKQFLPPSGNFTNQAPYVIPAGIRHVTFYITYTYGAPGGYALLRLIWGNGTEEAQQTLIDTDITIVQPNSLQNTLLQDLEGPIPSTTAPVSFMIEASVPGGATTVRLIAAEGGIPGAPGTIGITLTASTD